MVNTCLLCKETQEDIYMQELVRIACESPESQHINILEIGSWAGGSAISWAEAIVEFNNGQGNVVCVDLWQPYFETSSLNANGGNTIYDSMNKHAESGEIFNLFTHNITCSGYSGIVSPFRGASDNLLPLLRDSFFDIVFIDGDHRYRPATRDILNSVRLVKEGGFLCGDDLEIQIDAVDKIYALKNANKDFICDPNTKEYYHPGVTLAVGQQIGPVSAYEGFWVARKSGNTWKNVFLTGEENRVPSHLDIPYI